MLSAVLEVGQPEFVKSDGGLVEVGHLEPPFREVLRALDDVLKE